MVYMTIVPMAACYLGWFAALANLPAAMASTSMLLVPLIGVTSAVPVLGEPLGLRQMLALALTLGGVALAVSKPSEPPATAVPADR